MKKVTQSFFSRWTVIPAFENRVFIVKDEKDAGCPMLPIWAHEYDLLRTENNADGFQAMLVRFKNNEKQ